jgi:hypothetical protein
MPNKQNSGLPRPEGVRGFERTVADLITETTDDGRLEVALSIAATSKLVKVDTTTVPFTTTPDDLFDRTFSDDQVGIDDENLMRIFKAHLKRNLPKIKDKIETNVPPNPALEIELVAQFVRAALRSEASGRTS